MPLHVWGFSPAALLGSLAGLICRISPSYLQLRCVGENRSPNPLLTSQHLLSWPTLQSGQTLVLLYAGHRPGCCVVAQASTRRRTLFNSNYNDRMHFRLLPTFVSVVLQ